LNHAGRTDLFISLTQKIGLVVLVFEIKNPSVHFSGLQGLGRRTREDIMAGGVNTWYEKNTTWNFITVNEKGKIHKTIGRNSCFSHV